MDDKEDTTSTIPHMDLANFEDPQFEDSKYVLTSPRSLEACSKLGVKPVDMLYKPLAEFQEELLPQEVPLRTIYNIYDEHEQNRERKLALCREERNRIMDAEKGLPPSSRGRVKVTKSKKSSTTPARGSQARNSKLRGKKTLSQSDQNLDRGSLQRQRTAWATSVGHERVSKDEINERVKELHNESVKLKKELLSRKEARSSQSTKKKTKTERPSTARRRPASARPAISRSFSASDLSLVGTSMLNKTALPGARPIASARVKKALRKSDVKPSPITQRDEKILELIVHKHEEEKADIRDKFLREIMWDRQKKEEEAAKLASEMKRRRLLAEENRIKSAKQTEQHSRQHEEQQSFRKEQERLIDSSKQKWATRYTAQQKLKELKAAEKIEKELLRKRIQETNVASLERDEEEMKGLVRQKQDYQVMSAAQKKEVRLLEESMRVMMNNREERRNFEDRWNCVLKDTHDSIDALAVSMDMKDSKHKRKHDQILQRRDNEITLSRLDREKRALQAKLSQQQQESEMEDWRDSILTSREMSDRHAHETMAQGIERKARKAHEERVKKEKEQRKNIKKIIQDEETYMRDLESVIDTKDRKSSSIQREKDYTIQQSRQLAATSHKLRDSLRNNYGGETFDQMAFKAELYNKFESTPNFFSSQKNSSHVKMH